MIKNTALIIGGSMTGLLSARVLSEHFEQVIVMERDVLPTESATRKGTPQARHVHLMLKRGTEILQQYFPGLYENVDAREVDITADLHLYHLGKWGAKVRSSDIAYSMSRPQLEALVRSQVKKIENVKFIENVSVMNLILNKKANQVVGVLYKNRDTQVKTGLEVTLVVDASGRGSRMPQWLESAGYARVKESKLTINMRYTTRVYEAPENFNPDWNLLAIYPSAPSKKTGLIGRVEDNKYIVTFTGRLGLVPPTDEEGFIDYARDMPQPHIYDFLRKAKPVADIVTHQTPSSRRRHYENLQDFPDGLAILGDAVCSFNPVWGQGMTTAALETLELAKAVEAYAQADGLRTGFGKYFQKQVAKVADVAWTAATSEDMRHPEIGVKVPLVTHFTNWYVKQIHDVAAYDGEMNIFFMRMMNMMLPPTAAFAPKIVSKVVAHLLKGQKVEAVQSSSLKRTTQTYPALK